MLVLTRKVGDSIQVGPDIVVKVLEIQGNRVQLGIAAPKDVKVADAPAGALAKTEEPNKK